MLLHGCRVATSSVKFADNTFQDLAGKKWIFNFVLKKSTVKTNLKRATYGLYFVFHNILEPQCHILS